MGKNEEKGETFLVGVELTPKEMDELESMVVVTQRSEEWVIKKALKLYFQAIKEFE